MSLVKALLRVLMITSYILVITSTISGCVSRFDFEMSHVVKIASHSSAHPSELKTTVSENNRRSHNHPL